MHKSQVPSDNPVPDRHVNESAVMLFVQRFERASAFLRKWRWSARTLAKLPSAKARQITTTLA